MRTSHLPPAMLTPPPPTTARSPGAPRPLGRALGGLFLLCLSGCPEPRHEDIGARLDALEATQAALADDITSIRADIALLDTRASATETGQTSLTERVDAVEGGLSAATFDILDNETRLTQLRVEVAGDADIGGIDDSRLDLADTQLADLIVRLTGLEGTVTMHEAEFTGEGAGLINSRLDGVIEEVAGSTGDGALADRVTSLEAAGFVTGADLDSRAYASAQSLAQVQDDLAQFGMRIPADGECGPGEVLVYNADDDWFECAPTTSVGRVLNITTYVSAEPQTIVDYSSPVVQLDQFDVEKVSPTSVLIVQGSISAVGEGAEFASFSWQYGESPAVPAQLANLPNSHLSALSTTAVIEGAAQVGVHEMVLNLRVPPGRRALQSYNPDNSSSSLTPANQSVFTVWEVEQ